MDALPKGTSSNSLNKFSKGSPSRRSWRTTALTTEMGTGSTESCKDMRRSVYAFGNMSTRVEMTWPLWRGWSRGGRDGEGSRFSHAADASTPDAWYSYSLRHRIHMNTCVRGLRTYLDVEAFQSLDRGGQTLGSPIVGIFPELDFLFGAHRIAFLFSSGKFTLY